MKKAGSGRAPRVAERWRVAASTCATGALLLLSACATNPPAPPPAPAPRVEGLPELMQRAEAAQAAGDREGAREAYRQAAKAQPTSKEPWLKLALSYYDAGDFSNAVQAAQEVLQRDSTETPDPVASNILAISGFRVAATGVTGLRKQNAVTTGTRIEAEKLQALLRELLADPGSAPPSRAEPPAAKEKPRAKPRVSATIAPAAKTAPAAEAKPAADAKPAASPAPGGTPFDKLK